MRAATPSNGAELAVADRVKLSELLEAAQSRMQSAVRRRLDTSREKLAKLASNRELTSPTTYINDKRQLLDHELDRLSAAMSAVTAKNRNRFTALAAGLDAMSPLKVLSRGYSVASRDGVVIKSAKKIMPGDNIGIRLKDGSLDCEVREVNIDGR